MLDERVITAQPSVVEPDGHAHYRCGSLPPWRVVRCRPAAAYQARTNLERQGYVAYLPQFTARIRDRHTPTMWHEVTKPLFGNYLFVQLDPRDPSWPVRNSIGVAQLLPGIAARGAVEALQAGEALRRTSTPPGALWRPGDPSQLAYGPFQGLPAVVQRLDGDHATVQLIMLGQLRSVRVPLTQLQRRD